MRASRVTVDIDGYIQNFRLAATRAYHELDRVADETEVRVSSSGSGIHVIGWFTERLSDAEKERLRRHLGDDKHRIRLDKLPSWHRSRAVSNVCWTSKGDGSVDEFDDVYAALDHISGQEPAARFERDVKAGLVR